MQAIYSLAERNMAAARRIIDELDIPGAWASIGAQANLIGSLRTGLLVKHRDIDFHIYSDTLDKADSFRAVSRIASHTGVYRAEFTDLTDTDEHCIEWHAWYRESDGTVWTLDMIHIQRGTFFDGYMERFADRLTDVLTPETRDAVLRVKYEVPDGQSYPGVEVYRAVLEGGVRDYEGFLRWREQNPPDHITLWMP
ncbi:MAG: phosphoglycerate mutase family protein [Rikenellaceae bacterium]|nr:phosphoglycerate mutase family protein [Rikenellaceae bacterium]